MDFFYIDSLYSNEKIQFRLIGNSKGNHSLMPTTPGRGAT